LSQAITVELDDYYYIYNALANTGSTGSEVYGTYYVSPGYSSYNIGSITTHVSHDYYDSYGNSLEDTQDYSYYSNFVAGSVYVLE
jgi:hypothetical protein